MTTTTEPSAPAAPGPAEGDDAPRRRPRRRVVRALLLVVVVLVVLVAAAVVVFLVGRDRAEPRSTDAAVEEFRQSGASGATPADGRPAAGVYRATATGTEAVGIPGLDESFGPSAPATVTHDDGGCFSYKVDLNTHHWRQWSFCPTADATFALTGTRSSTVRKVPGLDFGSVNTYVCETPVPYLWADAAPGDRRTGSCTGTSDTISGTTTDAAEVEVVERTGLDVGGRTVDVVHVRTTDTFAEAQRGTERDELWLDAATGLPVKVVVDARITSDTPVGTADYVESGTIVVEDLVPTT